MDTFLTIDAGTTSVKTALFDQTGRMVRTSLQEYALLHPAPDRVELPAEVYWHSAVAGIRELMSSTDAEPERVVAIAVTSQGETLIPVSGDGRPLRNAIVWLDNRAAAQADTLASSLDLDRFYTVTGLPEMLPTWPACKILWLRDCEPETVRQTHKYLLVEDYLVHRLCGEYLTEGGVCTSTGYFDIRSGTWWNDMLDLIGVTPAQLPELAPVGAVAGHLTQAAADETGLVAGTPVVTGSMDVIASAVGVGNISPGLVSETTGTSLVLAATVDGPTYDPLKRLPCYTHAVAGRYLLQPYCQTAGMVLRWFRDQFCEGLDYDALTALAAAVPAGGGGLLVLPHFTGATSPHFNPRARGVFYGVTLQHTRAHFVRAIVEAVAFSLRENVELLQELGVRADEVIGLGGAARSALWLQVKADVLGLRLVAAACEEATSLGAAVLAACAVEVYPDLASACRQMVGAGHRFEPDPEHVAQYEAVYTRYLALYQSLEGMFGGW